MQATITYLLTEQAQRAQMAATGQPVARKQTMTIEVSAEDLPLLDVSHEGVAYLDLATAPTDVRSMPCMAREWRRQILGGDYLSTTMPEFADPPTPDYLRHEEENYSAAYALAVQKNDLYIAGRKLIGDDNIRSAIQAAVGTRRGNRLYDAAYLGGLLGPLARASRDMQIAKVEAKMAEIAREQFGAVNRFMSDPDARVKISYKGADVNLPGAPVISDRFVWYGELYAEAQRREQADADAKDAKDAALTAQKAEAMDAFVAASGDELLQQQYADGLCARSVIVSMMASAALDAAGLPGACPAPTACDDSGCPCADTKVDTIPPAVYAAWKAIGPLPEGSTAEFREVRNCTMDDDDQYDGDTETAEPTEYHALITVPSGPFRFVRRIKLS
jgi:hypothetical protein